MKNEYLRGGKNQPEKFDIYKEMSPDTEKFTKNHLNIL